MYAYLTAHQCWAYAQNTIPAEKPLPVGIYITQKSECQPFNNA